MYPPVFAEAVAVEKDSLRELCIQILAVAVGVEPEGIVSGADESVFSRFCFRQNPKSETQKIMQHYIFKLNKKINM